MSRPVQEPPCSLEPGALRRGPGPLRKVAGGPPSSPPGAPRRAVALRMGAGPEAPHREGVAASLVVALPDRVSTCSRNLINQARQINWAELSLAVTYYNLTPQSVQTVAKMLKKEEKKKKIFIYCFVILVVVILILILILIICVCE